MVSPNPCKCGDGVTMPDDGRNHILGCRSNLQDGFHPPQIAESALWCFGVRWSVPKTVDSLIPFSGGVESVYREVLW